MDGKSFIFIVSFLIAGVLAVMSILQFKVLETNEKA